MFFDTHAHYYADAFDADRDQVLSGLSAKGVELVLCPGCDLATSQASIDLAETYDFLYAAAGIHPEELEGVTMADLDRVKAMAAHPKVRAIGEIGLDYYWLKTPQERANSRAFFDAQLSLAEELDLPAIVHDRDAHGDCMDIVRAHPNARGVFHCCAVSLEDARVLIDRGWLLSFTGNVTFQNARRAPEVISWAPLDRLMVETDAPYMAPEPFRGKRCDSGYVYRVAETIAQLKGLTTQAVAQATTANGRRLFHI